MENNPENSENMIWASVAYCVEYQSLQFLKSFIDIIITKVSAATWSPYLTMSALYVLEALVDCWVIHKDSNLHENVLIALSAYCQSRTQLDSFQSDDEKLVCKAYEVLRVWIANDQRWSVVPNLTTSLIRCAVSGMKVKKFARWSDCAQQLLFMVSTGGVFPLSNGARTVSSLLDEREILEELTKKGIRNPEKYVRYYAFKNSLILTTIEDPLVKSGIILT